MNYKNGKLLFDIYRRLKELRLVSYTNSEGVVMIQWQGKWEPYHIVMGFDKRLLIKE